MRASLHELVVLPGFPVRCLIAGALALSTGSPPALAAGAGNDAFLEEIVVTAQKREQRLNDVGLAVAVLSATTLARQEISTQQDLAAAIPGLSYAITPNGTPVYTLRGIGFNETSLAAYPAVSSYLDEVPLSFPVLAMNAMYDLERVEVLKGPQGTLFGQNSTGGAINYIAAKPTAELEAGGRLSIGRFDRLYGEGYLSGALSPTLLGRISLRLEESDGWQESDTRPADDLGAVKRQMGRVQLAYEPSEDLRLLFNLNGAIDKSDTQAPQYLALVPSFPVLPEALLQAEVARDSARSADWSSGVPFRDNRLWQTSLRAEIDLTPALTLTSITAYVDYDQEQGDDGDGLPLSTLDLLSNDGEIQSFFQEVRLAGAGDARLSWLVGANYEKSTVDQSIQVFYPTVSFNSTVGAAVGYNITSALYGSEQEMESYAFFGSFGYELSQLFTLNAAVRYTDTEIDNASCNADPTGLPFDTGPFFFDIALGGAFGPYEPGLCFAINNLRGPVDGVEPFAPGEFASVLSEDNVSWRIGLDARASDDLLFYLNIAEGYKAGSFPTLSASAFSQYLPVTQESVLSYEAGAKATVAGGRAQLNGALFYYDYTDKQLRSKVVDPVFGILDGLQNIPESQVTGVELELQAQPIPGLVLNAAFTYLDAEIEEFTGINASGLSADFSGTRVPFTPEYQATVSIDYTLRLSDKLNLLAGATFSARSDTTSIVGGDDNPPSAGPVGFGIYKVDSYETLDLRVSLFPATESWRVTVWGKNVTDTFYWNNVITAYDTAARYAAMPATWGITLAMDY
jgi:outer membrane receptor protein involved in Fe transport